MPGSALEGFVNSSFTNYFRGKDVAGKTLFTYQVKFVSKSLYREIVRFSDKVLDSTGAPLKIVFTWECKI